MNGASCIYTEDWWLDAAAPGAWERVAVEWDNRTVAALSFIVRRRMGLRYLEMPPLCRTGSPRLSLPAGKDVTRRVATLDIVADLVSKLPRADRMELRLAPECPTVQGFVHAGCALTHTFTYRSPAGWTPPLLLANAHKKTRNLISHAAKTRQIEVSTDADRLMRLHRLEFGACSTIDRDGIARVFDAAQTRDRGCLLVARDSNGADVAAAAIVWDADCAYYWLTARDPMRATAGDNSLLIYEAMTLAAQRGLRLDLDGYGSRAAGLFLMKFGLEPVVRAAVNRSTRRWKLLNAVTNAFGSEREESVYRV